jgi:putative membrane protein
MDPYYWWGWGHGFGWMWIVPFAFLAVCVLFAFGFFVRRPVCFGHEARRAAGEEGAREILDRRYAKGEINKQQYEEMKHALET